MFNYQTLHSVSPQWMQRVRRLASETHALLSADVFDAMDAELLLARIDRLRRDLESLPHQPALRWLDALRGEVEVAMRSLDDSTVIGV